MKSGREAATFGRDNLAGLQPNEEGFIAYICVARKLQGEI